MTSLHKTLLLLFVVNSFSIAQTPIAIVGGTLIDGTGGVPVKNSVVVIRGTKIIAVGTKENNIIPDGARVINADGKYIIPGLIDCHVHYEQPRDLVQMLAWGVTSVNCMFESTDQALEMERRTANDTIHSPQIYATAPVFTCEGGWWHGEGFPIDSSIDRFPKNAEDAREAVRKAKAKGIKRIKLMYDDMGWCRDSLPRLVQIEKDVMEGLVQESLRFGILVEVHAPRLEDAKAVLNNSVYKFVEQLTHWEGSEGHAIVFAHGFIDEKVDIEFVKDMLRWRGWYVPTSCVFEFLADTKGFMSNAFIDERFIGALPNDVVQRYKSEEYYQRYADRYPNVSFVKSQLEILQDNMKTILDNRVNIAMGTDMWAFPGIGAHLELSYMVQAGMTPMQALNAATRQGGKFLNQIELGTVEPGKQADVLILETNPLDDIRNTRTIRTIIKHGKIFDHQQLIEDSRLMK